MTNLAERMRLPVVVGRDDRSLWHPAHPGPFEHVVRAASPDPSRRRRVRSALHSRAPSIAKLARKRQVRWALGVVLILGVAVVAGLPIPM